MSGTNTSFIRQLSAVVVAVSPQVNAVVMSPSNAQVAQVIASGRQGPPGIPGPAGIPGPHTHVEYAGTQFSGTNVSGTLNSNGLSLSVAPANTNVGNNIAAAGSTAGNGTVLFSNSNNITFGLSDGVMTASAATQPQSAWSFSNANGVSFGTNGSTVTASVKTDYLTTAALSDHAHSQYLTTAQPVGNYLTTARASNDGIGLNSALTANGVSMTANSSGLSLNFPAFLTTAAQTNVTTNNIATANSTLFQHTSATSAITSNAFPSAQTTKFAGTGFTGTNISGTINSNGVQLSVAPGGGGADGYNIIAAGGSTAATTGTIVLSNSNNVSFGLNGGTVTASASFAPQTVDTNKAGTGFTSTTTAGAAVLGTLNTNGLSLAVPAYLTTAQAPGAYLTTAAQSNHSHGNPTLNLTNLSGTTGSNSAGLTLSLSAAAQTVQTQNVHNVVLSGNTAGVMATVSSGTMTLAGGNNITVSQNGNAFTISGPNVGGAQTGISGVSAGTTVLTSGTVVLSNSNNVSFGLNGSTVTASASFAQSADTNKAGTGFTTTTAAGAVIAGTNDTNGLRLGVPAFLTTAQPVGAYLTTARGSTDAIGLNTALTANGVSVTANSSGLSLNFPAFLTTAQPPGAYLTTAAQSSVSNVSGVIAGSASNAATSQTVQLSGNISFANGSGVSFFTTASGATSGIAATVKTDYLTTARASNDGVGLNTALTAGPLAMTINSSGLSLNAGSVAGTTSGFAGNLISGSMTHNSAGLNLSLNHPAWLTTAAQSNHSHGNPSLALTNLNGTTASNSAGLTLSLSAVVPAQTVQTQGMVQGLVVATNSTAGGTATVNNSTLALLGSGVTAYQTNGSQVVLSVATNYAATNITTNNVATANSSLFQHTSATSAITSNAFPSAQTTKFAGTATTFAGANVSGSMTVNSNGVNLSLSAAAPGGGGGAAFSAGTQSVSTGTVEFANSNGITFGMSNSNQITASHNGLTTAALSNHSHGNPSLALTNLSGTTASNSNGLTLSLSVATSYAASNHSHNFATAITNGSQIVVLTTNSAGVTIGVPAFLTTAAGAAFSAGTQSVVSGTVNFANSNGITFGMSGSNQITASHNGLTTAAQSNQVVNSFNGSTGQISLNVGSSLSASTLGSAITFGLASNITTALQSAGAYLTTAAVSNHSHGFSASGGSSAFQTLNFANSNGITFSNSNGSVIASHNGLTTAAQSNHSHGNPTLNLTNLSGTTASNSAGFTLSLSAGAGGAGDGVNIIQISGGNTTGTANTYSTGTMNFAGGSNVTLSQSSNTISIHAGGGGIAAGSQTAYTGTLVFSNSNGVTFGMSNSSVVTASFANQPPAAYYAVPPWGGVSALITNVTAINGRPFLVPFENIGNLTVHEVMWPMSRATSGSNSFVVHAGLYSYVNSSQVSLISSTSNSYSATNTASVSGICLFEVLFSPTVSLTPGQYMLGMLFTNGTNSTNSTASMNYSLIGGTTANPYRNVVHPGADNVLTHTSHAAIPLFGRFSTTTVGLPDSFGQSQVIGAYTGASAPIPMNFTIGTHN